MSFHQRKAARADLNGRVLDVAVIGRGINGVCLYHHLCEAGPRDRPISPAVALKRLRDVPIGDIFLETVEGGKLRLRRVARPNPEQAEIIAALGLSLPERICTERDVSPNGFAAEPHRE